MNKTTTVEEWTNHTLPDSTILLDVRTSMEFAQSHLPNSQSIPLDKLEKQIALMPELSLKSIPILLICQSGRRALQAQEILTQKGYYNTTILQGGINSLMEAHIPLERSNNAPKISLIRQVQLIIGLINIIFATLALFLNPWFAIAPLITGVGLFIAGASGTCGLALLLAKCSWNKIDPS